MTKRFIPYVPRVTFLVFILSFSLLFYYSSPDQLIAYLGVQNAYAIMFVLACIGGLTTFSGVPYHLVLIALATGGANPLWLGLSAAVGDMLGDSTSYLIGYSGRDIIPEKAKKWLDKLYTFGARYPVTMPIIIFIYGSISPFSNDFIVISAGLAKYSFWKVMLPLALGNVVFNVGLAYVAGSTMHILPTWLT